MPPQLRDANLWALRIDSPPGAWSGRPRQGRPAGSKTHKGHKTVVGCELGCGWCGTGYIKIWTDTEFCFRRRTCLAPTHSRAKRIMATARWKYAHQGVATKTRPRRRLLLRWRAACRCFSKGVLVFTRVAEGGHEWVLWVRGRLSCLSCSGGSRASCKARPFRFPHSEGEAHVGVEYGLVHKGMQ